MNRGLTVESKGKVALFTFFRNNFGSFLQCYSTKTVLEKNGWTCNVFEVCKEKGILHSFENKLRSLNKAIRINNRYSGYLGKLVANRLKRRGKAIDLSNGTHAQIDQAINEYLKPINEREKDLLKLGLDPTYSFFITGSDQVWNPSIFVPDYFFLNFAPKEKRVAFAPSIGINSIPKEYGFIKDYIKGFNQISLREEESIDLVKTFYKGPISRVGDPAIMLSKNQWQEFSNNGIKIKGNYFLINFLDEPSSSAIKTINEYLSKIGDVSLICIGFNFKGYKLFRNHRFLDSIGPKDYVSLILNAKEIFTDSFHTSLFSIILNKCFFCFERQYSTDKPQEIRILDLLNRFSMSTRYIKEETDLSKIKTNNDETLIQLERENTTSYLLSSLEKGRQK